MQIMFRPRAEADLSDIWDYTVAAWGQQQAVDYLSALDRMIASLTEFPEMARVRDEFVPPVRIHPFRKYLIIYQTDEPDLDIIRVLHCQSNWAQFLTE